MKWTALIFIFFSIILMSGSVDLSLQKEVEYSLKTGLNWLVEQQQEDGSWEHYPAITGLAVLSILGSNEGIGADFEPVAEGLSFMASCADLDGSIHVGDLPNYNTSICLLAFKTADDPQYEQLILAAEEFLLGVQLDEGEGFSPDSLYYGGIGYDGSDNRPDLSNMNWVMESLKHNREREIEKSVADPNKETKKLFYEKALVFLSRCQNLEAYNPEGYAVNDGGFIYEAGKSKAGGTKSYGSMTYIGLKSMIYADLSKEDPRVQAAYNWIRENYRIEATPFMGNQGLFYYYQVMAKSLHAYGDDILVDKEGIRHNWRQELAGQLIKIQNEEGWWQNENGRWRENNKILVTIYCILSLEEILKS